MAEKSCPGQGPNHWTMVEAIELCRKIEDICPAFGCHVALTGGTLYKDGPRKDVDILFYRIRQVQQINLRGLYKALVVQLGVQWTEDYGWVKKATINGKKIDFFFPEEQDGVDFEYDSHTGAF